MKDGEGEERWPNGDSYKGSYAQDKMNGMGTMTTHAGKYVGNYKNGFKDGLGTMSFRNGDRYEGTWKNNKFHV